MAAQTIDQLTLKLMARSVGLTFVLIAIFSVGFSGELNGAAWQAVESSSTVQDPVTTVKPDLREVGPPESEISEQVKKALNSLRVDSKAPADNAELKQEETNEKGDPAEEELAGILQETEEQGDDDSEMADELEADDEGPIPTIEELEAAQRKIEAEFHLQTVEIPESFRRLGENHIWIDMANKKVMARGMICLRRGGLEMFACPRNTKEHESIISVHADSFEIHRCFEALGFKPGNPVQWGEEYVPAKGPIIDIEIQWMEDGKLVRRKAQQFVRNFETKKALDSDWVFGGSVLINDHVSGEEIYYGDGGELICLSNFATATMDLPIKSSAEAEMGLMFEAFTENIPQVNSKVYLVMSPRLAEGKQENADEKESTDPNGVKVEDAKTDQEEPDQLKNDTADDSNDG